MLKCAHRPQRGFSLTEISIVLALAGLLLGVIWVTASTVMVNSNVNHTQQEITAVVQNIRAQFENAQTPPGWTAGTDLTVGANSIDALQLFQSEMRRDPTRTFGDPTEHIDHALYSPSTGTANSFRVVQAAAANENKPALCGNVPCFRIILSGLSQAGCVKLLESLPLTDPALGIVQAGVYAATDTVAGCTALPTACLSTCTGTPCLITSMPSVPTASGWCSGSVRDNVLFVDYKLRN